MAASIQHIEDLEINEFIESIRKLNEYDITEKVDGFHILFGINENGFYTSGKDGLPKYRIKDYGVEFRYSGFKSAHKALVQVLPELLKYNFIAPGDEISAEVLYGKMPNTVPYDDETNKIIFLGRKKGDPNIDEIKNYLNNRIVNITVKIPKSYDGKTIEYVDEPQNWLFAQKPRVKSMYVKEIHNDIKLNDKLAAIEDFLKQNSGIHDYSNADILAHPLNKRPEGVDTVMWKDLKVIFKERRTVIRAFIMNSKLEIKNRLLDKMVRNIGSAFGPEDGSWIEGVVLRNEDDQIFKLVDKDVFTALNTFNWDVRNKLSAKPKSLKSIESIIGKIRVALATEIGHPELATLQKKSYIRNNEITEQEIIDSIRDFDVTRNAFIKILDKGIEFLEKYHTLYSAYKHKATQFIDFGEFKQEHKISNGIDEKNLESFAELFNILHTMRDNIYKAKTKKELAQLII